MTLFQHCAIIYEFVWPGTDFKTWPNPPARLDVVKIPGMYETKNATLIANFFQMELIVWHGTLVG